MKIMAIVDRHGLPLSVSTHAANHHEVRLVQLCFDFYMIEAKPENLIGDRAYDSDPLDEELRRDGVEMIAPHRANRIKPPTQDRRRLSRYMRRWLVERFFAWIQCSAAYSSAGNSTLRTSSALSNSPASLSSSDNFEIGSKLISEHAAPDAVFTFDVGTPSIWVARYLKMNGQRRLIGSLVHGSMANAMPQAIGAQVAYPGRQVISLSGDGGFAMLMGDFLTLVQQKLPVKIVVFNNGTLGFVALEMKASGFLETGTSLTNPDFAAMARAIGVHAVRVEDPGELEAAVEDVLSHNGPALLDVLTNPQELAMPPTITLEQVEGFSLWALRAVINGRGDELIEVAKSNLLR